MSNIMWWITVLYFLPAIITLRRTLKMYPNDRIIIAILVSLTPVLNIVLCILAISIEYNVYKTRKMIYEGLKDGSLSEEEAQNYLKQINDIYRE